MTKVKLGDVAFEYKGKLAEATRSVGLEHLSQGDVDLLGYDEGGDNTFTKAFKEGQVLLGRRRAYLKKASVAPFDGVCSGDIICIEAKEDRLSNRLLPFVIQNDNLFDFAVENSAGSLSPRVKWSSLAEYEFNLPDMRKQEELAELLWTAQELKRRYKKLLIANDEIVKSRFIEMFEIGSVEWPAMQLIDCCAGRDDIKCGPFGSQLHNEDFTDEGVPVWGIPEVNAAFVERAKVFISSEKAEQLERYSLKHGDIAMSRKGKVGLAALFPQSACEGIIHSDVLRIRVDQDILNPRFLIEQFHNSPYLKQQVELVSPGAIMAGINVTKLKIVKALVPPLEMQNEFVSYVEQIDKSGFALKQAIEDLNSMMSALLNEELGLGNV